MIPKGFCHCGCGEKTWIATQTRTSLDWIKGEPVAYVKGHSSRLTGPEYVKDVRTGCWNWQRALSSGYGLINRKDGEDRYAHRRYYERKFGPIPDDMTIDHLCRNRACVNPDHMEIVTRGENNLRGGSPAARNARKTHCKRGHPLSGDNLLIIHASSRPKPRRVCRTCHEMRRKRAESRAQVTVQEAT